MPGITSLRKSSLFAGLSDPELAEVAACLVTRTFGKGVFIFHKDSPGQTLYIIESGRVRIFILSESGQEISLNVYGPGEVIGELSFLDGKPRSASAVATEPTITYALRREDFFQRLEAHPRLAVRLLEVLAARLRYTTAYAESLAFLDVNGRVAMRLLELRRPFRRAVSPRERPGARPALDTGGARKLGRQLARDRQQSPFHLPGSGPDRAGRTEDHDPGSPRVVAEGLLLTGGVM